MQVDTITIPVGPRLGDLVLEADHLRKAFGERLLLEDATFRVPPGAVVGIIGGNGAGKSTLFRCAACCWVACMMLCTRRGLSGARVPASRRCSGARLCCMHGVCWWLLVVRQQWLGGRCLGGLLRRSGA